jgi:hypothetical protein
VLEICSECIDDFRILTTLLKPVLPGVAASAELFLQIPSQAWSDIGTALPAGHAIGDYKHLLNRIDPKQVDALLEGPKAAGGAAPSPAAEPALYSPAPPIGIDEFSRIDLRVSIVNSEQSTAPKTAEIDARRRRSAPPHRVRGHQIRLSARGPDRTADAHGREPRTAQDEVRRFRGHGARGIGRGSRHLPALTGCRSAAGNARQVILSARRCVERAASDAPWRQ